MIQASCASAELLLLRPVDADGVVAGDGNTLRALSLLPLLLIYFFYNSSLFDFRTMLRLAGLTFGLEQQYQHAIATS